MADKRMEPEVCPFGTITSHNVHLKQKTSLNSVVAAKAPAAAALE